MLWGPEFKVKGNIDFIGEHNGSVYTYRYYKKDVYFEKYEMENMTSELSVKLEITLNSKKERLSIEYNYILPDGSMSILASRYDKSTDLNTIYGKVISGDGEVLTDWTQLSEITATSKRNTGNFVVALSPDNKKLLITANMPYDKKGAEKYKLSLFTQTMEKLWEREFELPYSDKSADLYNFQVNNNGITYVLASVSPETKKERKQKRKEKEDINTQVLITYNGETEETLQYEISLKNKTVLNATIRLDTSQNVILTGFYRDNLNKRGGLSGVFFARIKNGETEPEIINTKEFEQEFIEQIIGVRRAKKGNEIPTSYNLDHVITTADGGVILLAEQFYMVQHCTRDPKTGVETCYYTYHYNSIIAVGINPEGEIVWNTLIPKESFDRNWGVYLSYSLMITDNALHLVFLDHKKNLNEFGEKVPLDDNRHVNVRKSAAVVATIDLSGQVTYSVLYDSKKSKVYMRPKVYGQLNGTSLAVLGLTKKKRTRLGRIVF